MNPEAVAAAMDVALAEADAAVQHGDVPIGAVIVERTTGRIIAARHNERELLNDPCAHAEVLALRDAARIVGSWRLDEYACVVTLEPCPMCAGAIFWARIDRVVYASTIADALNYGQFDDQPIYEDLAKPIGERLVPAAQCLREEMLDLWRRYEAKPDKTHY
jgi:tRNA(Arg) A34 adenosine deaminase TadA